MKKNVLFFGIILSILSIISCKKDDDKTTPVNTGVLSNITVSLDANKPALRGGESLLGNLTADAWYFWATDSLKQSVDFALVNGGGMVFDQATRPDGIYPAGDMTMTIVNEIFFYDNTMAIVEVTGAELKSILERSVSVLPGSLKGWFLQCSENLKYTADLSKKAQVLNETNPDKPVIATEGERITSIKIKGVEYSPTTTYKVVTINYLAEGKDGFVTFANIPASKKQLHVDYRTAFVYYLKRNAVLTPKLTGRIVLTGTK